MTSTSEDRLIEAHDLARAALLEITPESTVGQPAGHRPEGESMLTFLFENRMPGYPGWFWAVTIARLEDAEATVLETELIPGEGALLAPEWVPWAERLADYQAVQAAAGADASTDDESDDDDDDDLADVDDLDAADFDQDGSPILHAGDVDGVDIDVLDESAEDFDDDSDDDDDDSDDDDSDGDDDGDDGDDDSDDDEGSLREV